MFAVGMLKNVCRASTNYLRMYGFLLHFKRNIVMLGLLLYFGVDDINFSAKFYRMVFCVFHAFSSL